MAQGNISSKTRGSGPAIDPWPQAIGDTARIPGEESGNQEAEGHDGQRNSLQPQENQPLVAVSKDRSPHHQKDKDVCY